MSHVILDCRVPMDWDSYVASLSPRHWWKFDEPATAFQDSVGGAHETSRSDAGITQNVAPLFTDGHGKCFEITTTGGMINVTNGAVTLGSSFTWCQLFRRGIGSGYFFRGGNASTTHLQYNTSTGVWAGNIRIGSTNNTWNFSPGALAPVSIHLISLVWNGSMLSVYIDDALAYTYSPTIGGSVSHDGGLFGASGGLSPRGLFDDRVIFPTALTAGQIATLWAMV